MKKILFFVFILLCLLSTSLSFAFDNEDFQYWCTNGVEAKLTDKWNFKAEEELRFGGGAGDLYYEHTDGGVYYTVNKNLELSANYRQIFSKKSKHWNAEYRPHVNGTLKAEFWGFTLKDRNRCEYQIREEEANRWVYRNKLSLDLPFQWTPLKIQPYTADEIFFAFNNDTLYRNRLYAGFKMVVTKNIKGEIYYMRQSTKDNGWKNYNVFGTNFKLVF